ncbi:MAG: hypothetical protein V4727_07860 [Verrucomicrobiota bacterium]
MLPETHPLIDSITQPLADNAEMRLSAVQILVQTFDPAHPSVTPALERLESQDKKKFPALGKIVVWISAVIALGFALYAEAPLISLAIAERDSTYYGSPEPSSLPAGLTKQEQILLGEPGLDELTQKEQLLESDPNNPAYFAEYAQTYQSTYDKLPPDFLETAARIDPQNSFFLYWAAGEIGKDSIEKKAPAKKTRRSGSTTPTPAPRYVDGVKLRSLPIEQEYTIKDQAAYDEALAWIKKASELPKFDNYEIMMMKARMRLVSSGNTFAGFMHAIAVQYGASSVGVMSMTYVSKLMEARAEELSKNGRKEDFISLAAQRDAFLSGWAHSENRYLVSELVYAVIASGTAVNLHAGADRLGLTEMKANYGKQSDAFTAERDFRDLREKKDYSDKFIVERASAVSRLTLPMLDRQVQSPPPLLDSDLKPMRMAEHELMGRCGLLSIALLLIPMTLVVFLFRFFATRSIRLTAKRLPSLLRFSDWIWIFILGIAIPILAFLYISRISPVSGRDYGSSFFLWVFPGLHLSVLLLNLLLIPAVVTRWRLSRRAAAFKFGSRFDLLSLPVIGIMLIYSLVAYPLLVKYNLTTPVQIGLAAPLVGWLGFVFFNDLRIILGSARSRIIQTATAIAVIPAYPLAIIALCLVLPLYHAGEKYWIPKDKVHLIDPDAPDLGAYEFKVAAQKRKEINAIMGIE